MSRDEGERTEEPVDALEDEEHAPEERFRRLFGEKLVPEILRRGLESGMDTFLRSDRGVRKAISDLKLKRELTNYFFHQVEETKNAALRVIAREVRDFLENTDLDQALRSVLTSLAFEIRTEVRFVPADEGPLRPQVKSAVVRTGKPARRKDGKKPAGRKRRTGPRKG
jgi:hypothetical protein